MRAFGARNGWRTRLLGDALLVGTVLAIGALLQWNVTAGSYVELEVAWPVWRIPESFLWAAVLLLLITMPMNVKPLVANRVWAYLGVTSYSIYLIHTPLLLYGRDAMNAWFPGVLRGWTPASAAAVLVMVTITLALATLTYRWIELPWMRRKVRVPVLGPTMGAPASVSALQIPGAALPAGARLHHTPRPPETL